MQFSTLLVAAAATAAVSANIILTPPTFAGITEGVPFEVTWADAVGDVTVILLDDTNPLDVKPLETLASGLTGTVYTWIPPATLTNAFNYAIKVQDQVTYNYGAQFQFVGGVTPTTSATSASSTAVSATTTSESSEATESSTKSSDSATITSPPTTRPTSTPFTNSTTSRPTGTASNEASSTKTGSETETNAPTNNNSAGSLASPLALVLLTFAAFITLN